MLHKSPIRTGHAKSIHHMITQLVQKEPSAEPITSRRPSLLMRPEYSTGRRSSQILDPEYSTSRRSSQMTEKETGSRRSSQMTEKETGSRRSSQMTEKETGLRRPSSQEHKHRALSAHHGSRRHTVCSVSGTKLHKSPVPHAP